jgi:hypothetical protein
VKENYWNGPRLIAGFHPSRVSGLAQPGLAAQPRRQGSCPVVALADGIGRLRHADSEVGGGSDLEQHRGAGT